MKIYDNSNLAESYSGVTTPLTASFAQFIYCGVYKNFCDMMGVSRKIIKKNSNMFTEMVVYIGGRMYYDLTNWYKLVSFLPGYSFNRVFFEDMLGVDKRFFHDKKEDRSFFDRWFIYFPITIWQVIKISFSFLFMGILVNRFCINFDKIYGSYNKDLSTESLESLKKIFRDVSDVLVVNWKVPIANDFAVMVSTGIVRKLFDKWLPGQDAYKFLYIGSRNPIISLDPGLHIKGIIEDIKKNKNLENLFKTCDEKEILLRLRSNYSNHRVYVNILKYINDYGNRMPGELKLESKSLDEYPEMFISIVSNAIRDNRIFVNKDISKFSVNDFDIGLLNKFILRFFLGWSRKSISLREETRFKRTLIFGFARKIFLEIGKRLEYEGVIDDATEIFLFNLEEVLGNITDKKLVLKQMISNRKRDLSDWRKINMPKRIETSESINIIESDYKKNFENIQVDKRSPLAGMVVSTGNVVILNGTALVMKEFDPQEKFNDKIVVTSHTDPGWSMVFPLIRGLIVENGGMLSHAAIVAREFNIPCIVGVQNATDILNSGDEIEMNLDDGRIIKTS
jgi:pyruvate,water dikinase